MLFFVLILAQVTGPGIAALADGEGCPPALPIDLGQPAPCPGVLWNEEATKLALQCQRVELPLTLEQLAFCKKSSEAKIDELIARASSAEAALETRPDGYGVMHLAVSAVVSVAVGILVGYGISVLK